MITFKDQSLLINNEKIYPFGAEIHYFRVPKDQWRQSIMKAKEAGMNMISTYRGVFMNTKKELMISMVKPKVREI